MKTDHPIGSLPSRLRTMARSLGSTIRDCAEVLEMPHATLGRRLDRPEEFTIDEALRVVDATSRSGATNYRLQLVSTGKK